MFNVILPTYNEGANILRMINMLAFVFQSMDAPYSLIVVDDNSSDGTAQIAKQLNNKSVKVVEREGKLGLGSAYKEGIKHCTYDHTIILDADLQQNPLDIVGMARYCKDYDIVSSTRYTKCLKYIETANETTNIHNFANLTQKECLVSGKVCNWKFSRKFISIGANMLSQVVLGIKVTDTTCSFRIYKTEVLKKLLEKTKANGFGVQMELITRAVHSGMKIKEYPITFYNRTEGESKLSVKEYYAFFVGLIKLYFISWF